MSDPPKTTSGDTKARYWSLFGVLYIVLVFSIRFGIVDGILGGMVALGLNFIIYGATHG